MNLPRWTIDKEGIFWKVTYPDGKTDHHRSWKLAMYYATVAASKHWGRNVVRELNA